jgi:hypothetical protein
MTIFSTRAFASILALSLAGCSPDYGVDGTWERCCASGDHFGSYVMQLRRDGDRITGLACRLSSGYRIFSDRPVAGTYPRMSFDFSLDNSGSLLMDLMIVQENLITGTDNNPGTNATYDFAPAPGGAYEACARAPAPQ